MIPNGTLSSNVAKSAFVGSRANKYISSTLDFEDGGIALSDTSAGLIYQTWSCRIDGSDIKMSAESVPEFTMISGLVNPTEISLAFDQAMRPVVAYVDDGVSYLYWYDTTTSTQKTTSLGSTIRNPRVTLDDKRITSSATSDVILAYLSGTSLCYRQQRDRYLTEYTLTSEVPAGASLVKIGLNAYSRLQFKLAYTS